jgi:hypothetical protein
MKVSILHNEHGLIIAVSKIPDLEESRSKFAATGMIPGKGQRLVDVELDEELRDKDLRDLHSEYRVDLETSKLVKKE